MKPNGAIDFAKIDWSKISKKKAKFIYTEAIARLDSIHKNNDGVTNKAIGMLSFAVPVLTALIGYFVVQWNDVSAVFLSVSVCAVVFLFAILVLLLLVLLPKGMNSAQGEPAAYFSDNYYSNTLEDIYKGNIRTLHSYIIEDRKVLVFRGSLFRVAIILFTAFPAVAVIVVILVSVWTKY